MNERIRQLAEQAFFDESTSRPSTKMYTFSEHKMEKFAELIVKECMDIAYDHTPNSEECEYKRLIHNKIKEHFGVEE
jgi:hypothetical protein